MTKLTIQEERKKYLAELFDAKYQCKKALLNPNSSQSVKNTAISHIQELDTRIRSMLVIKPLVSAIKIVCMRGLLKS